MKVRYPIHFLSLFILVQTAKGVCAEGMVPPDPSRGQLQFIENKGQWDNRILYSAALSTAKIFLEQNRFSFVVLNANDISDLHPGGKPGMIIHGHVFREQFLNTNPSATASGNLPFESYNNYFLGNDPKYWKGNVPLFHEVDYASFYPGIDLKVYSSDQMKYEFAVAPGADASAIMFQYEGADKVEIINGQLVIGTSVGNIIDEQPFAYQLVKGEKKEIACKFILSNGVISFEVGHYNKSLPLIIDPTMIFSSYTGSTADNWGYTATYDAQGDLYLGGYVNAIDFTTGLATGVYPTTVGAFDVTWNGGTGGQNGTGNGIGYSCDMGITKFNPTGTALIYSTYLGGSDNETPHSMIVDPNGNLVIYGVSYSTNYPVTAGAYDNSYNGNGDVVVTVLNNTCSALVGSTYVGGSAMDGINYDPQEFTAGNLKWNYGDQNRGEVILDANDNIYVATCTQSTNFPVSAGAYQTTSGGAQDGCAFKLNSNCSSLVWSTYLGGSSDDACYSLDITPGNSIYVCGGTMSANFPATAGTIHPTYQGGAYDGFVAQINSTGTGLLQSSFIGTSGSDQVYFVKLDQTGDVYFVGQTTGSYPTTGGVYSNPNSGQFISKLNPALSSVTFSTVFGNGAGQPNISPTAFLIDTCENIYVAGWGNSSGSFGPSIFQNPMSNMPLTAGAYQTTTDGTDFYLIVLSTDAQAILYGTYFGGNGAIEHVDGGTSRFDKNGIIYEAVCAGCGGNSLTPTTPGVWSPTNQSANCNELGFKMAMDFTAVHAAALANPAATGCVPLTVNFQNGSTNATQYNWDFGDGAGTSIQVNPVYTYTDTGTYTVMLVAYNPAACIPYDTAYTTIVVYDTQITASFDSVINDFCDSIQVIVSGLSNFVGTNYQWDFGDSTTATGQNASHMYTDPGVYTVTMIAQNDSACSPLDTVTFTINFTDVVTAQIGGAPYFGCSPLTVTFSDLGFGGTQFYWDFDDGTSSTLQNPVHTFTGAGAYDVMLVVSDPSTCNGNDTAFFTVTVLPAPPVAAFTATPSFVQDINQPIHFENQTVNGNAYTWLFGDGDTSHAVSPDHLYQVSGTYQVCLVAYNDGGCADTACSNVKLELIPIIGVPNAWSPNGDGQNDILWVEGQDIKTMDFKVFNRWGELVFESTDINDGWDGIYKGVPQEMEVYVWTLTAQFSDGKIANKQGNVTLLR